MSDSPHLIIGTRGSDLALWQAHHVRDLIQEMGGTCEIKVLSTQGDREQVQAFEKLEGKGFFTKEIEEALLDHRIDVAVHSHKDLETTQPEGLTIAAVPPRAAAQDVLLVRRTKHAQGPWLPLRGGAVVGTSSVRRRDQLLLLRPDLDIQALRGNVPTRIARLREGRYDAIVLAAAGLDRLELELEDLVRVDLDPRHFVPAPAQGALALQMREDDSRADWLAQLTHDNTAEAIAAERSILRALDGGCQLPFGAHRIGASPIRAFLQSNEGPHRVLSADAASTLDALQAPPSALRLLVTRTPKTDVLARLASGAGCTLIEHPSIALSPTGHPAPEGPFDGVWLSSPGAVRMAADWLGDHPEVPIAVPGSGTADALTKAQSARLCFVGSGDPIAAWRTFAERCEPQDRIALPHSVQSMRRWETDPVPFTVAAWPLYSAEASTLPPPAADIVCFTSPSNVRHWSGSQPATTVAIGPTTSAALTAKGWSHRTAESPDAFGIWEAMTGG